MLGVRLSIRQSRAVALCYCISTCIDYFKQLMHGFSRSREAAPGVTVNVDVFLLMAMCFEAN